MPHDEGLVEVRGDCSRYNTGKISCLLANVDVIDQATRMAKGYGSRCAVAATCGVGGPTTSGSWVASIGATRPPSEKRRFQRRES